MEEFALTVFVDSGVTATFHGNMPGVTLAGYSSGNPCRLILSGNGMGRLLADGMACHLAQNSGTVFNGRLGRVEKKGKCVECDVQIIGALK